MRAISSVNVQSDIIPRLSVQAIKSSVPRALGSRCKMIRQR